MKGVICCRNVAIQPRVIHLLVLTRLTPSVYPCVWLNITHQAAKLEKAAPKLNFQLWPVCSNAKQVRSSSLWDRNHGTVSPTSCRCRLGRIAATRDRTLVLCRTDHSSQNFATSGTCRSKRRANSRDQHPRLSTSKSRPPFVNIFPLFLGQKVKKAGGYSQRRDRFAKSAPAFPALTASR